MRISDWSSDVCSSDLAAGRPPLLPLCRLADHAAVFRGHRVERLSPAGRGLGGADQEIRAAVRRQRAAGAAAVPALSAGSAVGNATACRPKRYRVLHAAEVAARTVQGVAGRLAPWRVSWAVH